MLRGEEGLAGEEARWWSACYTTLRSSGRAPLGASCQPGTQGSLDFRRGAPLRVLMQLPAGRATSCGLWSGQGEATDWGTASDRGSEFSRWSRVRKGLSAASLWPGKAD